MTSPVPGAGIPSPISWGSGYPVTTPRLRGDCTNMAALLAGGAKPMFAGDAVGNIKSATSTNLTFATAYINTWQVPVVGTALYGIPLAGFYLCQAFISFSNPQSNPSQAKYVVGFSSRSLGVGPSNSDAAAVPGNTSVVDAFGGAGAELIPFGTFGTSSDSIAAYGYQNSGVTVNTLTWLTAEWVGERFGTVVTAPKLALTWPPGPGTTIANGSGVSAGSSGFTVADATGMVPGGVIGLDYYAGQPAQPTAETVTISTVTGNSIGFTATTRYFHAFNAPVSVPVSAAFLNQQVRDAIRFLSYPPMMRAATTTTQSITNSTQTQITNLSASIDTFSGFASNAYTIPVAGTYFVYGQVYLAGSTTSFQMLCGITVNAGGAFWGTALGCATTSGAQSFCSTYRRTHRFNAGDVIRLVCFQSVGSSMNTVNVSVAQSKLIVVFRSF